MPKGRNVYSGAHASLRVMGENLDPSDVTKALQLPPDTTYRRGDPRLSRARNGRVVRYSPYSAGMWSMTSKGCVHSGRLETHVAWLLNELEPVANEFRDLLEDGIHADIFCYSVGSTDRPPAIPNSLRDRAARLGLIIDIDHYDERGEGAEHA